MNKKIILPTIVAVLAISAIGIAMNFQQEQNTVSSIAYVPSDISKELTGYELVGSSASYVTTDIRDVKDKIKMTIRGTVISVGDPVNWDDTTINPETKQYVPESVKVPIQIQVDKANKVNDVNKGDVVTIYVFGDRVGKQLALEAGLNFETGEKVLVHVGEENLPGNGKSVLHVVLGSYGKYTIQDNVAYNEHNKNGKEIAAAVSEAQ
jgi:hypothetical protein